jgi:hypothetical protein
MTLSMHPEMIWYTELMHVHDHCRPSHGQAQLYAAMLCQHLIDEDYPLHAPFHPIKAIQHNTLICQQADFIMNSKVRQRISAQ